MKIRTLAALLFACLMSGVTALGDPPPGFQNEIVVVGLDQPTVLKFTPDGRMLVGELQNYIYVVQPDAGLPDEQRFLQLDNTGITGTQGLMDIELDPDFEANGYYYVFYTKGSLGRNRVSRFTAIGNQTDPGSEVVLWQGDQPALEEHQGGSVVFGADGKLYISVGEAFVPDDAPRLDRYRGKILRINRDGSIPADNPFHDGSGPPRDSIWALGLRNPFRLSFDAVTGRIFECEVGGNDVDIAMEEINLLARGANYGWPDCEGACGTPGFTSPIYAYPHAGRDACVIGGCVYRGNRFPNAYYGNFFFADYAQHWIRRLTFDANGNVNGLFNFEPNDGTLDGPYGDPTCLKEGPDGALYYTDFSHDLDNFWAMVRRIRYTGTNDPPSAVASAFPTAGLPPLNVGFSSAGSLDPEGQPVTYLWTFGDGQTSTLPNPSHDYQQAGMYSVRLAVSDGTNTSQSAPLAIVVGDVPSVTILSPTNGLIFRAGDVINFSGSATDVEDGPLAPSALNWTIVFHHSTHIHPVSGPWSRTNQGSLTIPTTGHPYYHDTSYEIFLIATDSSGLQASTSVTVYPDLVDLSFDTAPSGLTLKLDGISRVTPFSDGSMIGFQHSLEAPDQALGMSNFIFQSWSDGGARNRPLIVPDTDLALTATYRGSIEGAPLIESAAWTGNVFRLMFSSTAGRQYRVERSSTLLPGSWTTLADQVPGTGASVVVADPLAGTFAQAFYRVNLLPPGVSGPPEFSAGAEATDLDVSTLSATLASTGANRVLLAGLCWNDDEEDTVLSVTYNGVPCAHVLTTNWFYGSGKLALYSLTAPAAGSHALQVTMSGSVKELSLSGMIFTNANQSASLGLAMGSFTESEVDNINVTVPSATNDLVVDLFGYNAFEPAPGPGQTVRSISENSGYASTRMSAKPGAAGFTTMSWSLSDAAEISLIGVAVKGP
jgi:glucose/arabinose dehydrogenase/PKD repeat protein